MNSDGSTNLIPEYFAYLRGRAELLPVFKFYFPWACCCSIFSILLITYSIEGIVNSNGQTLDYLSMFLNFYIANVLIFNFSTFIETNAFPVFLIVLYVIGLCLLILVLMMGQREFGYEYYKSIDDTLASPVYCLAIILQVWFACIPRWLFNTHRKLVARPEFVKLKDQ